MKPPGSPDLQAKVKKSKKSKKQNRKGAQSIALSALDFQKTRKTDLTGRKGVRGKPRKGFLRKFNPSISELFQSSEIVSSMSKKFFFDKLGRSAHRTERLFRSTVRRGRWPLRSIYHIEHPVGAAPLGGLSLGSGAVTGGAVSPTGAQSPRPPGGGGSAPLSAGRRHE